MQMHTHIPRLPVLSSPGATEQLQKQLVNRKGEKTARIGEGVENSLQLLVEMQIAQCRQPGSSSKVIHSVMQTRNLTRYTPTRTENYISTIKKLAN